MLGGIGGLATRTFASFLVVGTVVVGGYLASRWRRNRSGSPEISPAHIQEIQQPLIESGDLNMEELRNYVKEKPKIELHCHLNGTVRRGTLLELLPARAHELVGTVHTIEDAFATFKLVYEAVDSEVALRRIVRECVEDAISDNVIYLELRTTPRKMSDVATRREYVKIVVDELSRIETVHKERPLTSFPKGKIVVRLILTIDRAQALSAAEQTVDVALRFPDWVVGIDFAGNPNIGRFQDFVKVFNRARGHGLSITIHTSEIRDVQDETQAILDFKPNRIGHFLFANHEQVNFALTNGIAIESCPSSNICALSGKFPETGGIINHSLLETLTSSKSSLFSINTDDPGVFGVTLSDELFLVAKSFKLSKTAIDSIIDASANHSFLPKNEKDILVTSITNY
jgi:adenosine deaminase